MSIEVAGSGVEKPAQRSKADKRPKVKLIIDVDEDLYKWFEQVAFDMFLSLPRLPRDYRARALYTLLKVYDHNAEMFNTRDANTVLRMLGLQTLL